MQAGEVALEHQVYIPPKGIVDPADQELMEFFFEKFGMTEYVKPMPEPTTFALVGAGLAALSRVRRRRRQRSASVATMTNRPRGHPASRPASGLTGSPTDAP